MKIAIKVERVEKVWPPHQTRSSPLTALSDVNLQIERGQFIVLLGPSGCGKSTLLRMIAGLDVPTAGRITLNEVPIAGPGPERGMIFQDYALFPWRNVLRNVTFGLEARGIGANERSSVALELINLVGLSGFESAYPGQLSGGMQQRVSLARALANDPEVLLMDEPFSAVDSQTRETLQEELLRIWRVKHKTVIFVTHDIAEAAFLADRVVTMATRPGRVRSDIAIGLERPRDRTNPEFVRLCRRLREELTPDSEDRPEQKMVGGLRPITA
ncbi:MAG: ABC transporter ATP-binding protein [Burkholderiaceae bacterium]|nr:ABC transporter ATP-binding protein [Burkholderiaceae bacterium]